MGSWEENVLSGAYSSPMPISDDSAYIDDDYTEEDLIDEIY